MSFSMKGLGRSLLVVFAMLMAWSAPVAHAQVQADSEYHFEADDGNVVLSNVSLAMWDAGDGDYLVKLTLVPTQEEINELLRAGSHVDLEFSFLGLERSGERSDFAPSASDYVRQVGAVVEDGPSGPVFRALGFNIEKRWIAGEAITITASIYGYEPSGDARPRVSVDLVSSTWWFADGNCDVAYSREKNDNVDEYCTEQGARSTLVDSYGDIRFPF